jgi:integrase
MSRESSPLIVGAYWLDKRRDRKSPEVWQITTYSEKSRCDVYRSTKCRSVDEAGAVLRAHEAAERSKEREQPAEQAEIIPHLFNYLREQGPDVLRLDTMKSSFNAWIGFLMQDELGMAATIAQVDKNFANRFRRWRMKPHQWEVAWSDKTYRHKSPGVSGKAVQRNIEDMRAALHHAEANNRIVAPKVASVNKKLRPKNPRGTFTIQQLGAIIGYANEDKGAVRELCLMIATGCRPGNALAFNPAEQWLGDILDLQPKRKDLTDKRAAVLPVIRQLRPILADWTREPHDQVKSRKRFWRTMRRVLAIEPGMDAYSIRTTVSTYMDEQGVPGAQLSGIIGHLPESRGIARTTSEHYLGYDPHNAKRAKAVLEQLFREVRREAKKWSADHRRTIGVRGRPITLAPKEAKVYDLQVFRNGGR